MSLLPLYSPPPPHLRFSFLQRDCQVAWNRPLSLSHPVRPCFHLLLRPSRSALILLLSAPLNVRDSLSSPFKSAFSPYGHLSCERSEKEFIGSGSHGAVTARASKRALLYFSLLSFSFSFLLPSLHSSHSSRLSDLSGGTNGDILKWSFGTENAICEYRPPSPSLSAVGPSSLLSSPHLVSLAFTTLPSMPLALDLLPVITQERLICGCGMIMAVLCFPTGLSSSLSSSPPPSLSLMHCHPHHSPPPLSLMHQILPMS